MAVISMDGTDPADWDPRLDALVAAPQHHRILYEDETVRVLSVGIEPGVQEPVHHHRWPSVFVIDSQVDKLRDFDSEGREIRLPIPDQYELPLTLRLLPQPLHSVHNEGSRPFHGTQVEFKRGIPDQH